MVVYLSYGLMHVYDFLLSFLDNAIAQVERRNKFVSVGLQLYKEPSQKPSWLSVINAHVSA